MRNDNPYSRASNSWLAALATGLLLFVLLFGYFTANPFVPGARSSPKPVVAVISMRVTAYTSDPKETDSDPFITASGTRTQDGTAGSNALPIGTEVVIPKLFGNKIFVIKDRMNPRFKDRLDVWMERKDEAKAFGIKIADVHVIRWPTEHRVSN